MGKQPSKLDRIEDHKMLIKNKQKSYKNILFEEDYIILLDKNKEQTKLKRTSRDTYYIKQLRIKLGSKILFMKNSRTRFEIVLIVDNKKYGIHCNSHEYYMISQQLNTIGKPIDAINSILLNNKKGVNINKIRIKRYQTSNITTDEMGLELINKNDEVSTVPYNSIPKIDQELLVLFQNEFSNSKIETDLIDSKIIIAFWQILIPVLMGTVFVFEDYSILYNVKLTVTMIIVLNVTTFILSLTSVISNIFERRKYELIFPVKSNYKRDLAKTIAFMIGMIIFVDTVFLLLVFSL